MKNKLLLSFKIGVPQEKIDSFKEALEESHLFSSVSFYQKTEIASPNINRFETFYMKTALLVSQLSYATIKKVGCVLVKNNRIISYGFNGTPTGFTNLCEDYNILNGIVQTKPEVLHAESNAISKCSKSTESSENSILYTTMAPCVECAKLIIQSGIKRVYYLEEYKSDSGVSLLQKANVHLEKLNIC